MSEVQEPQNPGTPETRAAETVTPETPGGERRGRWRTRLWWLAVLPPLVLAGVLLMPVIGGEPGAGSEGAAPPNAVSSPYKFTSGSPAPDFTVETLDGEMVSLKDLRGKKVLVNFWATWCVPCRTEMPHIEELYAERKDQGLAVVAVNLEEGRVPVRSFTEKLGLSFPIALDTKGEVAQQYGVQSLPTTFFIDSEGRVASFSMGALNRSALSRRLDTIN